MFITSNPQNDVYKNLINCAFDICDEFILVERHSQGLYLNEQGKFLLSELNSSLKYSKEQDEWVGTKLLGQTATVYYYNTDDNAKNIVMQISDSLYGWVHPNFPEDLSFIRYGKPWLINVAHENESYIETEDTEEIKRILNIKGLEVSL